MGEAIPEALSRLDESTEPAASRFDPGGPLRGRIAILPSAFNPPTLAHQHLLERALDDFALDASVALLTTRNVDKGVNGASLPQRIAMLLALRGAWPSLAVAASNQARIIDQPTALADAFPQAEFDFIVGFDTLERLFAPRYYTDMERELRPFFDRHRILAANRADIGVEEVAAWIAANAGRFRERIHVLEIDDRPASMSSTEARQSASNGSSVAHVAPEVARYIEEHGLYR